MLTLTDDNSKAIHEAVAAAVEDAASLWEKEKHTLLAGWEKEREVRLHFDTTPLHLIFAANTSFTTTQ
jgi:transposase-like protein